MRWFTPPRVLAMEALFGLLLVCLGVAQWSAPAALVVAGVVIFLAAVWPAVRRR